MKQYILLYSDGQGKQLWTVYNEEHTARMAAKAIYDIASQELICVYELGKLVEAL